MKAVFWGTHMNSFECPLCHIAKSEYQNTSNKTWWDMNGGIQSSSCKSKLPAKMCAKRQVSEVHES